GVRVPLPGGREAATVPAPAPVAEVHLGNCTSRRRGPTADEHRHSRTFARRKDGIPGAGPHRLARVHTELRGLGDWWYLGARRRRRVYGGAPTRPRARGQLLRHRRRLWGRPQRAASGEAAEGNR